MVDSTKLNRMIEAVRVKINALDDAEQIKKLDEGMAISFHEHASYQNLKSEAQVTELITVGAALVIYNALGEVGSQDNGGWDISADLATKCVVTQFMAELLNRKLKARGVTV